MTALMTEGRKWDGNHFFCQALLFFVKLLNFSFNLMIRTIHSILLEGSRLIRCERKAVSVIHSHLIWHTAVTYLKFSSEATFSLALVVLLLNSDMAFGPASAYVKQDQICSLFQMFITKYKNKTWSQLVALFYLVFFPKVNADLNWRIISLQAYLILLLVVNNPTFKTFNNIIIFISCFASIFAVTVGKENK